MVAKGGAKLISNSAIKDIKKKLLRKIFLITPNIPETELLTNLKVNTMNDMINAGQSLIKSGARNVLIKGGHMKSKKMIDILVNENYIKIFKIENFIQKILMALVVHYLQQLRLIFHVEKVL